MGLDLGPILGYPVLIDILAAITGRPTYWVLISEPIIGNPVPGHNPRAPTGQPLISVPILGNPVPGPNLRSPTRLSIPLLGLDLRAHFWATPSRVALSEPLLGNPITRVLISEPILGDPVPGHYLGAPTGQPHYWVLISEPLLGRPHTGLLSQGPTGQPHTRSLSHSPSTGQSH